MIEMFLILFASVAIAVALAVCAVLMRRPSGPFHIGVIFLMLAVLDVYAPIILWVAEGIPSGPDWLTQITYADISFGVLYYSAFYILMLTPMALVRERAIEPDKVNLRPGRLQVLTPCMLAASIVALSVQIDSYGGVDAWFLRMSVARWTGAPDEDAPGGLAGLALLIPWRVLLGLLTVLGFYFRDELDRKYLFTYVYPAAAFLLALTTFFRGAVLLLILGLLFAERARRKRLALEGATRSSGPRRSKSRLVVAAALVTSIFVAYGAIRDRFQQEAIGSSVAAQGLSALLRQGSGIYGIAAIVSHYGDHPEELFLGRTYLDMLLLPIPRSIYVSKPEWYGIDDITRGMGWPETTQSAVTIPGEAFANFGLAGLLLAPIFGFLFTKLFRHTALSSKLYFFLYPCSIMYIVFISNWMSFSGLMNQFLPVVCSWALIRFFLQRGRTSLRSATRVADGVQ